MDLYLYNKSGCMPKHVHTSFNILAPLYKEKSVVSAVSGKKIVPMWLCVGYDDMGATNIKFDMTSGSTTLMESVLQSLSSWPVFMTFGGRFITKIKKNEDFKMKFYGSNPSVYKVTVGYYLI